MTTFKGSQWGKVSCWFGVLIVDLHDQGTALFGMNGQ